MMNPMMVLIVVVFCVAFNTTAEFANNVDAPALYKKHCSACHPDAARLRSHKNIMILINNPPPGMPKFNEDRISENDMNAIVDYIRREFGVNQENDYHDLHEQCGELRDKITGMHPHKN